MSERLVVAVMACYWALWYGLPLLLLFGVLAAASCTVLFAVTSGVAESAPPPAEWVVVLWAGFVAVLAVFLIPRWFVKIRERLTLLTSTRSAPETAAAAGAIVGALLGAAAAGFHVLPSWGALLLFPASAVTASFAAAALPGRARSG